MDLILAILFFGIMLLACLPTSRFHGRGRFRLRRERNWAVIGLMYASYYLCRQNLSVANKGICDEFGFTREQFGWIITAAFWAYAFGQIVNGLIADRIGGKKTMLFGAIGTAILNVLFGAASLWGILGTFITIRLLDGFVQSMGAPGMIKMNAAWFSRPERGGFAGIFGFMIQMGQVGIQRYLGPLLLTGGSLWFLALPPLHWRYLFWVPAGITVLVAFLLAIVVKTTPENAGFKVVGRSGHGLVHYQHRSEIERNIQERPVHAEEDVTPLPVGVMLRRILSNKAVWFCAVAYSCTGFVRHGVLNWYLRFFEDHAVHPGMALYKSTALWVTLVAVIGSIAAGYASDLFFKGRRAPVASFLYLIETVIILGGAYFILPIQQQKESGQLVLRKQSIDGEDGKTREIIQAFDGAGNLLPQVPGIGLVALFIVLIALTCNSTHSIIGAAAPMDIGGRKMAGFASGVIDSFQYLGGGLTGFMVGGIIDAHGYVYWLLCMAPAGLIGSVCMMIYYFHEKRAMTSE